MVDKIGNMIIPKNIFFQISFGLYVMRKKLQTILLYYSVINPLIVNTSLQNEISDEGHETAVEEVVNLLKQLEPLCPTKVRKYKTKVSCS